MRGVNKVILVGSLGNDPDVKYMPNGDAVCTISVATNEKWKDKNSGEQIERTEWHRVVFFRRLAQVAGEYLKKGSKVFIEGKNQTKKWTDKDNITRYTTQVIAHEMQMLDSNNNTGNNTSNTSTQSQQQPQGGHNHSPSPAPPPNTNTGNLANQYDDDIPF